MVLQDKQILLKVAEMTKTQKATHETTVQGTRYEFWGEYRKSGTIARNVETGQEKQISFSGYISNDVTVRKAIARVFGHDSFKK